MRFILVFIFCPFLSICQNLETVIQQGHELAVVTVAISPDSNYIATGSKDGSAKLWETGTGREVKSFLGHQATVTSVEFTSDGKTLVTGSNDKSIRFWDISNGKQLHSIHTDDIVTDVAIDPLMKFFVVAGYGNSGYGDSITAYDFSNKRRLKKISVSPDKGLGSGIDVAISPDGMFLAVGEDNRTTNLYNTRDWSLLKTFSFEEGWCGGCGTRVLFSPDSKNLYTASHNGPVRKYELASFRVEKTYEEATEDLAGFAISPDGKLLARATEKDIIIWNESAGDSIATKKATDEGDFYEMPFRNNRTLISTSSNNTATEWNFTQTKDQRI